MTNLTHLSSAHTDQCPRRRSDTRLTPPTSRLSSVEKERVCVKLRTNGSMSWYVFMNANESFDHRVYLIDHRNGTLKSKKVKWCNQHRSHHSALCIYGIWTGRCVFSRHLSHSTRTSKMTWSRNDPDLDHNEHFKDESDLLIDRQRYSVILQR